VLTSQRSQRLAVNAILLTAQNVSQFQTIPRLHQRLGNYDGHRLLCVGVRLWLGSLSLREPCLFLSEQAKKTAGSLALASDGSRSALRQYGVNMHEYTRGDHHQVVAEKHQHW
jgi:hypothetical protein